VRLYSPGGSSNGSRGSEEKDDHCDRDGGKDNAQSPRQGEHWPVPGKSIRLAGTDDEFGFWLIGSLAVLGGEGVETGFAFPPLGLVRGAGLGRQDLDNPEAGDIEVLGLLGGVRERWFRWSPRRMRR